MTRAAIYCRISKDRDGEALGVKRQEQDCRELAARLGWEVTEVFVDNDLSGYSGKPRPGYRRMLAAIEAGRIDAILCYKTSRLYRQLRDLLELIEIFERHGLKDIRSCKSGDIDLSTPAGRTQAIILARIDQQYSEDLSDQIKRKKRELAERGRRMGGGKRPFGETGTGKNKVSLHRALEEQEALHEGATYLLTGGTVRGLVADWNSRGITTSTDKEWRIGRIRELFLSPRLGGYTEYQGQLYEAQWAPIIPRDTWLDLRERLLNPARTTNRGKNNETYLLSGLSYCGVCGHHLTGYRKTYVEGGKTYRYRSYTCAPTTGGCAGVTRSAEKVEQLLTEAIFAAVESPGWDKRVREHTSDSTVVQQLLEDRLKLVGLLDRLEDKMARELVSEAAYKRNRADLEDELDEINRKLIQQQDDSIIPHVPKNLRKVWPDLSFDRQRSFVQIVLRSIGRKLVIFPQASPRPFDPTAVKLLKADIAIGQAGRAGKDR